MAADYLFCEVVDLPDRHIVQLEGELDHASAAHLADRLTEIAGSAVILDMSGLSFIDAAGVGTLVAAERRIREDGHELRIVNVRPFARKVFELGRASHLLAG